MGGLKSWKQKIWLKCVSRLSETDVVRCRPDPLTETECFFYSSVLVSLLLCCIYGSFGFLFSLQPPDKTVSMSCEENGFLKWARTFDSAVISLELAVDLLINSVIFFLKKHYLYIVFTLNRIVCNTQHTNQQKQIEVLNDSFISHHPDEMSNYCPNVCISDLFSFLSGLILGFNQDLVIHKSNPGVCWSGWSVSGPSLVL